ncbi:MAG: transcriptional regulator, LacI family [Nocardioidaceae bacterium]|nr:transcriptional regulator, LacI family [Nocardioidaceae bacterium]
MPRPTINDVASAAGVSKGAVSFALNDRPGVAPETRRRILEVAEQLGWTPSPRARALSVSKALAVGLVVARPPEIFRADAFFPAFISGLETVLSEHGHALLLMVAEHDDDATYRRLAAEGRVDGVFVTDLRVDDPRPALLEELGMPSVVVGPPLGDDGTTAALGVDDAPGIRAAVEHLVELGHTRIAHVAGPQSMVHGRSRRTAWAGALADAGLPEGTCVEADFSAESGAAATRTLLDLPEPPTAIVYANDLMAMAGLSLAVARGVSVPGDLSVTGFDDIEISAHLQPSLTTVNTDVVAWGRAAATRLLELIRSAEPTPVDLPPARLVLRGSTGPVPR